jgi:hypothetical protein
MEQDMLIYEFGKNYFLIQRGQQGKNPAPQTSHQRPSENTRLFSKLPISRPSGELGAAAVETLDNFDKIPPRYDPWENKGLNKQLCKWLGAGRFATLIKNSRLVQLVRKGNVISVIPFDNHKKNPWLGPMTKNAGFNKDVVFTVTSGSSCETIGKLIFDAFAVATCHPANRKRIIQKA